MIACSEMVVAGGDRSVDRAVGSGPGTERDSFYYQIDLKKQTRP
jgi:hypothetical protein